MDKLFNEIADISLYEKGLMKNVCTNCHCIFDISGKIVRCPICGLTNEEKYIGFDIYPIIPAIDIIYNILEIHHIASIKQKYIIKRIQEKFKSELDTEIEFNKIKQVLIKMCNIKEAEDRSYFKQLKAAVAQIHMFNDEELEKAYHFFISGDNHNRLYKSIMFLTATLVEILFKEYMAKFITKKINGSTAMKIMDSLNYKSIDDHISQINVFCEKDLKSEMECIEPGFYDKWMKLKHDRNMLIHRNEIDISSKQAEDIVKFVEKSVIVFMRLTNNVNGHFKV